jgi:hypothetical protein
MKTDPISAAAGYRMALERIMHVKTLHEARQLASKALGITYDPPEPGMLSISSGWGHNTQQPYVTIALANPQETANPAVQIASSQARQIAFQILEAAEAAEQDGFIVNFAMQHIGVPIEHAGGLLNEYRAWRERRRNER